MNSILIDPKLETCVPHTGDPASRYVFGLYVRMKLVQYAWTTGTMAALTPPGR